MKRLYYRFILEHLEEHDQMLFLMGPRQVGKTTLARDVLDYWGKGCYLSWDNLKHWKLILEGPNRVAQEAGLDEYGEEPALVIFDEIQKYKDWKNYLKGFYDTYKGEAKVIVTGSSKMDIFVKGGDSLMGRYFILRIHPFTLAEVAGNHQLKEGKKYHDTFKVPSKRRVKKLLTFGGFPDPFVKGDRPFYNRWTRMRQKQVFQEDIRGLKNIKEISGIETLSLIMREQVGQLTSYSTFSKKIGMVTDKTIKDWIELLKSLYFFFEVRPWHRNVSKSLVKQPKFYLWDWSSIADEGAKAENFVASHLLKAVHFWNDTGLGDYELFFIRDLAKKEVDFLITKDKSPWILIEVKRGGGKTLSKHLKHFYEELSVSYAFELCLERLAIKKNCFLARKPAILPATTFLSQLL